MSGCAELGIPEWRGLDGLVQTVNPGPAGPEASDAPIPLSGARSAEDLDQSTASERAQASASAVSGQRLGTTIASLGAPGEAGFWLKTPLVTQEQAGTIRSRTTGRSVAVTLIPIEGPATAGSRLSLSAMRALELPLTDLAELDVSRSG